MLGTLGKMEGFFTKGKKDSDVAVRARIRNASAIFVHGSPAPGEIKNSLTELTSSLAWAREHGISELESDALWGIYLCQSRLARPSEAADALIDLRNSLETMRHGIKDPLKRAGVFNTYPYLFNAMCEKLQAAGRATDLLEAIESSKGRVIADKLTQQTGDIFEDSAIYRCISRLPQLVKKERFHYVTYFVDDERVYLVLVSKDGDIHLVDPVQINKQELRAAAANVNPVNWGRPKETNPRERAENISERLAPLVSCFERFLEAGILSEGDHICYSADEDFHNIPIHFLKFRDGILLDSFSVSRVHSAFHIDHVLAREDTRPPNHFVGFAVPLRQDLERQNGKKFSADLDAPSEWLARKMDGLAVRHENATLTSLLGNEALDHRIIHFATHGWFPEGDGNPFDGSYLLLASEDGLPDKEAVIRGDHRGALTPRRILDSELNFEASHVSMMACVSGLAKEGIGGDTLGLDWAFIQAGASSLISTHWEISASCAARFFELFYQKWIEGKQSRASAVRATMIELLDGSSEPEALAQWTAFSLTGDFR